MSNPVALVGFKIDTMLQHTTAPKGAEVWTLNHAWKYDVPHIDRLFEIHAPSDRMTPYATSKKHDIWLSEKHPFPIYTLPDTYPGIPSSVAYPFDEISKEFCGHILVGKQVQEVFTSTFDYMIALALFEEFDPIHIYGFSMAGDSEYGYQRDGFAYWAGQADARGVDIVQCKESTLFNPVVYHKGGQMYARHTLESHKAAHKDQLKKIEIELHKQMGVADAYRELHAKDPEGPITKKMISDQNATVWEWAESVATSRGAILGIDLILSEVNNESKSAS